MPFLELTLRCTEATQPRYENALEDVGALAVTLLDAEADTLVCTIHASAEGQRDGLKGALERHIDRFAFREVPLAYNWTDG